MTATPDPLLAFLVDNGYQDLRVLKDGTIELLFMRAVCVDLDRWGFTDPYCYAGRALASQACRALASGDDTPLAGFVASRNR